MTKTIDAAIGGVGGKYEGKAYFFKGKQYAEFDWDKDDFTGGPSPLSDWGLTGDFADGIDAALEGRGKFQDKAFFFKGDKFLTYGWITGRVEPNPPSLDWGLPGDFRSGIDAAMSGTGDNAKLAYFFKGDQYVVYNWDTGKVDGGIKKLSDWKVPKEMATGIDTVLHGPGDLLKPEAFFFKGEKFVRYDWTRRKCDDVLGSLEHWDIPDGLIPSTMRFAWIEYEDPGDGVMLASGLEAAGWKNIFDELGPPGAPKRAVKPSSLKARVQQFRFGGASALLCRPDDDDAGDFLSKWVLNPGIAKGELTFKPTSVEADLVCVSGHGAMGEVWGSKTGPAAAFEVQRGTAGNAAMKTTGRVKYLIISACFNLMEFNASGWVPILRKVNPIHGILGYENSYTGDAVGAKVMRTFVALLQTNKTILQAWKEANLSVSPKQPWAALVHAESVPNTFADWVADKLPVPARGGALKHFGADHPNGVTVAAVAKPYSVAYRMANGTVIDETNNGSSNAAVGLIPGQDGALVLSKASGNFAVGDEITLLFFHYRFNKAGMDLDGLLTFDPALLGAGGKVTVTKLAKANPNAANGSKFDGLKIKVNAAAPSVEVPYKVSSTAHSAYDKDGPSGTYGYFPMGLYPPGTAPDKDRTGEVDHYTTGAFLK